MLKADFDHKEKWYKKAEAQLKEAGISVQVDRNGFGLKGYDRGTGKAEAVYVPLVPMVKRNYVRVKKKLEQLDNYEVTEAPKLGDAPDRSNNYYYHRLVYRETRGRKRRT